MVCIDDFAIKKRQKYGTVMINIETGKVVDMIESREYDDVKAWLETFPDLQIFSRDGSITYSKAIKDSHPKAIQISDRFHLLKNLTDYCKDYIKRTVKNSIAIEVDQSIVTNNEALVKPKYAYETTWDIISAVKRLREESFTIEQISTTLGLGNKTVIKYSKIEDSKKDKYTRKSTAKIKRETTRENKLKLINQAKALSEKGVSLSKIAMDMNLDRKTVKKYIESDGTYTHASLGITRHGKLSKFEECIVAMHNSDVKSTVIFDKIRKDGYTGSKSLVRKFISKLNHHMVDDNTVKTEQIRSNSLISLLYNEIDKRKSITKNQLDKVFKLYPNLMIIYEISRKFKEVLFSHKVDGLEMWINDAVALNIPELNSFINGISRDIDAVRNSIIYKYSNGLAEGTVNKIKAIKRVMYGRCGFNTLKQKVLYHNFT